MSSGARVLFTRLAPHEGQRVEAWRAQSEALTSRVPGASADFARAPSSREGFAVWHLATANHRLLARSAGIFASLELAVENAESVTGVDFAIEHRVVTDEARGAYGWWGMHNGVAVITCARWYSTERDRKYALLLALASLPGAKVTAEAGRAPTRTKATAR